uniref:Endonuclease/exonuclease/phosphatase domain-containing protein n=2 Tax=Trichogramma kaykai TaxID=54128 RepID=A0ABD2XCT3_9HYME
MPSVHRFNSRPLSKSRPLVRKNLKIGCININRFSANFNLLEQRILSGTYDIVSVVETFLESSDNISPFHIAGYNFLHCHRRGKEGGGVGLYVREELAIEKIVATESIYDYTPEYQIISIKNANNMKLLFATVYRSPEAGYPEEFFEVLYRLQPLYDNVIVTGDFNIHVNRPGDQHVGRLIKQLEQLSLHLVSTVPTNHVIYHDGSIYENCLDLVIVRDTSLIESFSRSSSPFAAAHDFIDFEYKLSHEIAPAVTKFTRDFRRVRTETFAPLVEREISIGFSRDGLSLFVVDEAAVGGRVVTRALLDLAVATLSSALLAAAYLVAPLSAPRPASRR